MTPSHIDCLARVENAETVEALYDEICIVRDHFGVDHAVYHTVQWAGEPFALATYPTEWANHYESERLYLIDPVVLNAFVRFNPYDWKTLNWRPKGARGFLCDAIDSGVGNQGLSLPIRGPHGELALFTLSHNTDDVSWSSFVERHRTALLLIGHCLHQAARRLLLAPEPGVMPKSLSPREVDTLTLLGLGLNRARIAERLKISEHTLRVYIESSRHKLGAQNTTHAVASALTRGLISI